MSYTAKSDQSLAALSKNNCLLKFIATIAQVTKFKYKVHNFLDQQTRLFLIKVFLDLKTRMDYFADPAKSCKILDTDW